MVSKNTPNFLREDDDILVVPNRRIAPPENNLGSDEW